MKSWKRAGQLHFCQGVSAFVRGWFQLKVFQNEGSFFLRLLYTIVTRFGTNIIQLKFTIIYIVKRFFKVLISSWKYQYLGEDINILLNNNWHVRVTTNGILFKRGSTTLIFFDSTI